MTEIKSASSEADLIKVIGNSMSQFRKKRNSFNESGYILNMIVALRSVNADGLSADTLDNIRLAAAIFTQFQQETRDRIC